MRRTILAAGCRELPSQAGAWVSYTNHEALIATFGADHDQHQCKAQPLQPLDAARPFREL